VQLLYLCVTDNSRARAAREKIVVGGDASSADLDWDDSLMDVQYA